MLSRLLNVRLCTGVQHTRCFAAAFCSKYNLNNNTEVVDKNLSNLLEKNDSKIIYSSFLEDNKLKLGYVKRKILEAKQLNAKKKLSENANITPFPVSLQYLSNDYKYYSDTVKEEVTVEDEDIYFPYNNVHKVSSDIQQENTVKHKELISHPNDSLESVAADTSWMTDYEVFDENNDDLLSTDFSKQYGSPDPTYKRTGPACGGCGAHLNCIAHNLPGYLPSELYKEKSIEDLKSVACQRCHFLKNYNVALNLTVDPSEYANLVSTIKNKFGLVLLLVDLLDFPCSIWPGITDILGRKRPVFIVGNKVDLLPQDRKGYLNNIKASLEHAVMKEGIDKSNIRHTCLISAETGYGVEELITKLHTEWGPKGDVYIVGCTNVGKSTLFNALLKSDYCKVQAMDLIQRATASPWPGTTLNMLKFPILRPSGYKIYVRTQRLIKEKDAKYAEQKLRKIQLQQTRNPQHATLIGHIGTTFKANLAETEKSDIFAIGSGSDNFYTKRTMGIDENKKEYRESKWCYDTPGVMQDDQILNLLTTEEIISVAPKQTLKVRNYYLKPNTSLLLGGLGRVDYIEGDSSLRISLFASMDLPVVICSMEHCSEIYQLFLGTSLLKVPSGSAERLSKWPELKSSEVIEVQGEENDKAVIDLLFSSAGWVSIGPGKDKKVLMRHWTPNGRGLRVRKSVIQFGALLKGPRIRRTPAYVIKSISKKY